MCIKKKQGSQKRTVWNTMFSLGPVRKGAVTTILILN